MVAYDLTDPLEFVGVESALTGLKVLKARNKDEANPSSRSFTSGATIGSVASIYTELKVFNGTVPASSLPGLKSDLADKNLWVNRDGYCYVRIPGSNSSNPPRPAKFMRLNDLFNWEDYADIPANQTFTPTPSTTVWNRHDSSRGTTKVDYKKLDDDLKKANDAKKKAEDDKKKAKDDKKIAEDELQEVRKQNREMDERMDRLKDNWANAARIGARPLPPSAFYVSSIPKPLPGTPSIGVTWMGSKQTRLSDPGSYVGSIRSGSIQIYNADGYDAYGNDGFETHFWWVAQMDYPNDGVYGYMIAYDGTGRYPSPTDPYKFLNICVENRNSGCLNLTGVGQKNVIILRNATRGLVSYTIP